MIMQSGTNMDTIGILLSFGVPLSGGSAKEMPA